VSDIDFAALMEPVARKLWGEPNPALSKNGELRWGTRGSKSVDLAKGTWFDHEAGVGGGVLAALKHEKGFVREDAMAWLEDEGLLNGAEFKTNARRIVATYDYVDEGGGLLFQVCRFDPKDFRQRRPDGHGGWIWNLDGVRRVLYRLPEVIEAVATSKTIHITEGEKDSDNLWALGIPATTNPGGARKWRQEYAEHLRGGDVVVHPHNDDSGREHMREVAASIAGTAARVRVLDIAKHWQECPPKGDVSDWLEKAGGTVETFWELVERAPDAVADAPKPATPLIFFEDCGKQTSKPELIKGAFAKGETSALIGPPGTGKSALLTSVEIALAGGTDWYGFRVKESCGVVHFAFERADLCKRRLHAHRLRDGLPANLPIAIRRGVIDLMDPKCVEEVILPAIREAEQHFGRAVGFAGFDTYNKGIALGGGDEDKARDQNRALANLRRLQDLHDGLHVDLVAHIGKDPSRGSRGSNALPGDLDLENHISAEGDTKVVTTVKANDAPEGELMRFRLQPYQVGTDEDGNPTTIWIASSEIIEAVAGAAPSTKPKKMNRGTRALRDAIAEALEAFGNKATVHGHSVRAVPLDRVREEFCRRHVVDSDQEHAADAKRKAFKRALDDGLPEGCGSGEIDGTDCIWK